MAQTTNTQGVEVGGFNANCGDTILGDNKKVYESDEDAQIMCFPPPPEPNNEHQVVLVHTSRFNGFGDWPLETKEFRESKARGGGTDEAG